VVELDEMRLEQIRSRLAAYRPAVIGEPTVARASVALVLREAAEAAVELLLIRRATRDDDPWSGHMAFPGGRRDPDDVDVVATATRETCEEVGLDLRRGASQIGRLDELRAVARHRPLDLVITPVVFELHGPAELRLSPREVESAVWVPLPFLASADARTSYARTLDGISSDFPAFRYRDYTIWGLTHRILDGFLELVGGAAAG
jgi:8-oxo-dGTP pyrophosphatase MutT (NUDIX family)